MRTGRFSLPGVKPGSYRLRVEALGYTGDAERMLEYSGGVHTVDVSVLPSPLEGEGIDVVVTRPSVVEGRTQMISGVVLDARSEAPLADLAVVLRDVDGEIMGRATTDAEGHFVFGVGLPGLYRLNFTRMGYESGATASLAVAPGQDVYVELRARPTPIGLDEIRVSAPRDLPVLEANGFYRRRELGRGDFYAPRQVESIHGVLATQLLRGLEDVSVLGAAIWFRGTIGPGGLPCHPTLVLDGMELKGVSLDKMLPTKRMIRAVEVYKHIGEVPQQWRGHLTCGVIAIWTEP